MVCRIKPRSRSTRPIREIISKNRRSAAFVLLMCGLSVLLTGGAAFAQDATPPMKVVHDDIVLSTARPDNWEIHITYFQSDRGKETEVVVLLHPEGGNRQVWLGKGGFAERLHNLGYAVIAVDLRKHGQSVSPAPAASGEVTNFDRQKMVKFDMEAVKKFIFEEHMAQRLNMNKTAIIAPEMSAAVAVNYAMLDWLKPPYDDGSRTPRGQDIRVLILLSPERNPRGLSTGKSLAMLGRLAANDLPAFQFSVLFCYGRDDPLDRRGETRQMYNIVSSLKASQKRVALKSYPYKYRGTDLVGANNSKTKCEEHILGFLDDHLRKLTEKPWQDRRSRFDRD